MKKWLSLLLSVIMLLACVACGQEPTPAASGEPTTLEVHFIDVGQADAALLICDGQTMLIDGGNREDSQLMYSYLKEQNVTHLDYVVATHAHEDHVGGLPGALNAATVGTALCSVSEYDSGVFETFVSQLDKQGKQITVPRAGEEFSLGAARVQVLGPVRESDDTNNMSLVLRVVHGDVAFLFAGDAEREEERDILDSGRNLESTVLKVGHHGSENSTTYPFLREIMPQYAVISVGADNSYGHPTPEAISRLYDADVQILRTDKNGTVVCTSDGTDVSFTTQRGGPEAPPVEDAPESYVLNTSSHKFHLPTCNNAQTIKPTNRAEFTGSRDELIARGYSPCGNCKP